MRAMSAIHFGCLAVVVAACGSDPAPAQLDAAVDAAKQSDAAIDTPAAGPFALTSTALAEGATLMTVNTCDGANTSPDFAWTNPPAGTQSFAVVLTDKTNGLVHWVIYDVPASASGLPAAVMKAYAPSNVPGAHQTASYQTSTIGYLGPCPPAGGGAHTYEFAAYALDATPLPGATQTTTRTQAVATIMQHMLGVATLTGMYAR